MPNHFQQPHWDALAATRHTSAGTIGLAPASWVSSHGLVDVPNGEKLPRVRLDRHQVRNICQNADTHVLFGYVCIMGWGNQRALGRDNRVKAVWDQRDILIPKLEALREGGLSRIQAYDLFTGVGNIHGLGPSYFTKLLFFFTPTPDFYIMDQWTGKSINLLTGVPVVRMVRTEGAAPMPCNKAGNYQAYCEEVDALSEELGVTGEQAEEILMSKGGRKPWPWREHVRNNWPANAPTERYSAASMHLRYPHIPENYF